MNIAIRVDSSIQIGTGHVIRCLTLAQALNRKSIDVLFICREHEGNLISFLKNKEFEVSSIPLEKQADFSSTPHANWLGADWETDSQRVVDILQKSNKTFNWLIVDHYALDYRWEKAIKPFVQQIMVIDGLADRKHDCDLLLDQNYYRKDRYHDLLPQGCKKLLGPQYALLKTNYFEERKRTHIRKGKILKILLSLGGVDLVNETSKALDAILLLNREDIEVDIVLGANSPHKNKIQKKISSFPQMTCHVQIDYMAKLMREADLAIGSIGTATWERCCLGLPTLAITVAANQEPAAVELAKEGFIYYLGNSQDITTASLARHLQCLLENRDLVHHLSARSFSLVDGKGTQRVLQKLHFPDESK